MRRIAFLAPLTTLLLLGCHAGSSSDPRARVPIAVAGAAYDDAAADHPHIVFPDGTTTANDRCMILQHKLNLKIPPIYVNGTPLGFC